jgi:hypothetical protein
MMERETMRNYWDTVWTFKTAQFTVELAFGPEDLSPRDCFDEESGLADEICDGIEHGLYLWFCARVRVLWQGAEIGADYLGGCCYKSAEEFIRDGYFRDMVREAVSHARAQFAAAPHIRAA